VPAGRWQVVSSAFFLCFLAFRRYHAAVSNKADRIARLIRDYRTGGLNPYFLAYIDCFNRAEYYEAHDVLEQLWLKERHGAEGAFYKGLIQLAGAFVHLQRDHLRPAAAIFRLAGANLSGYAGTHQRLAMPSVLALIDHWLAHLEERDYRVNPLRTEPGPLLRLDFAEGSN
jgi:hypothetical protein